jgi:hypothetical protein
MPVSFFPSAEQADEKPANKRRRKQNDEIGELGELLPFQGVGGKSLDKLSILRLSTSYIRFQNFMTVGQYIHWGKYRRCFLSGIHYCITELFTA